MFCAGVADNTSGQSHAVVPALRYMQAYGYITLAQTTTPSPHSWAPVLLILVAIVTLAIGAFALHEVEVRMIAAAGETLALTASEVSDKLDRFLYERYADARLMAGTFSPQPDNREFQSAYVARVITVYPQYLWIGVTNAPDTSSSPPTRPRWDATIWF